MKPKERQNLFEAIWERYPEKKGKHKAKNHFNAQVKTMEDYDNICKALDNYMIDVAHIRSSIHPSRPWQHGGTWFNHYWEDYIDYTPLPAPASKSKAQERRDVGEEWLKESEANEKNGISAGAKSFLELRGNQRG